MYDFFSKNICAVGNNDLFLHRISTIELWCNGNTTDSGSVILGSNPGSSTNSRFSEGGCFYFSVTPWNRTGEKEGSKRGGNREMGRMPKQNRSSLPSKRIDRPNGRDFIHPIRSERHIPKIKERRTDFPPEKAEKGHSDWNFLLTLATHSQSPSKTSRTAFATR